MYKSKLQELCQQRQWALPWYTSMKDGPDHNPCFKSSVFLNGTSFHSSVPFKSCKEAQNDAAKSAFLHSSHSLAAANPVQEPELGMYKNLLQELTRREEWSLPDYKTTQCGEPHRPTFFSSVEVKGHVFPGKGGKSKKEAEINAAKLAYTNLTNLKSSSQDVQVEGKELANSTTNIVNSDSCSKSVPVSLKEGFQGETLKSAPGSDLTPAVENEEHAKEGKYFHLAPIFYFFIFKPHFLLKCLKFIRVWLIVACYLLNNRFRVYLCYPDITFPQGITVVPISEDKWVAESLEFPNGTDD
ncbi:double-stranded RNA-binding protein 1-like [Hibiscus syriacus]|uniref:double-stranded RNA-binding protein 1-like n=1 Tax=Hibiscus syriacus TaxID=106335 RepID=UPI001921EAE0|nr:double-stranded RNA-binding protein 1-like [Hibiscus syriacus]